MLLERTNKAPKRAARSVAAISASQKKRNVALKKIVSHSSLIRKQGMTMSGLSCDRCRSLHVKCDVTRKPEDHDTWPGCNNCVEKAERTGEKVSDLCTNLHATLRAMKYLGRTGTQSLAQKVQPSETLSEPSTPGTRPRSPSPAASLECLSSSGAGPDVKPDEDTEPVVSDVPGGSSSSDAAKIHPLDLSEAVMQAAVAILQLSIMPEAWAATTLLSLSTGCSTAITA